jgi:hypothetical protein
MKSTVKLFINHTFIRLTINLRRNLKIKTYRKAPLFFFFFFNELIMILLSTIGEFVHNSFMNMKGGDFMNYT